MESLRKTIEQLQLGLFDTDDRVPEIIEPEEIEISSHKRTRKPKAAYEEQFDNLPVRQVPVNGSRFARAVTYASNQKPYMMTYLEDGHCSLSNNMSENGIRPVTVGRRNWLCCDTTDGADASMFCILF